MTKVVFLLSLSAPQLTDYLFVTYPSSIIKMNWNALHEFKRLMKGVW